MPLPPIAVNSALFAHAAPNAADATDTVSAAVVAAGKAIEAAYTTIQAGHDAHMANVLNTKHANLKRSADHADKVIKAVGVPLGQHANTIDAEIAALDTAVNAPLTLPKEPGPNYSVTAGEIRKHFADLSPEKRLDRAMRAVREKDVVTLGALLNAPPYLSGLDVEDSKSGRALHPLIRDTFRQLHFAAELERLAKLRKCRAMIDTAVNFLLGHSAQLHPAQELTRAANLDKAARDTAALAEKFV